MNAIPQPLISMDGLHIKQVREFGDYRLLNKDRVMVADAIPTMANAALIVHAVNLLNSGVLDEAKAALENVQVFIEHLITVGDVKLGNDLCSTAHYASSHNEAIKAVLAKLDAQ